MRAAVDCGRTDRGDMRAEMWWECPWRKGGQPRKQGDTDGSHVGGGAITMAPLSPHPAWEDEQ